MVLSQEDRASMLKVPNSDEGLNRCLRAWHNHDG